MVLGIDLGTTYSAAAFVDKIGEVQVITNREGKRITPSVFFEDTKDSIVIGEIAKENAYLRPEDVISVVKNHMGKKDKFVTSSGTEYVPEEISSYIIRKMVQDAEDFAGVEKITDVVVTVPAYFNDAQRKATEDAVRIAGLHMIGSINEPTAAMLSYVHKKNITQGNFMIYDLGGGTFDVSIVRVEGEHIRVLSTDGVSGTGGHFFDQSIVKYVCNEMMDKYGIDLEDEKYLEEYQELCNKAENCKIQLSSRQSAKIPIRVGDVKDSIEITREFFESKVKKLYRNTEAKMKSAIKNAGITVEQLDTVLLVGGSSRIPFIEERVREFTGKEPAKDINPDEAVAIGAAIFGDMNKENTVQKVFQDTNSHSIGFIVMKEDKTKENHILIAKNSPLPASFTQVVNTMVEGQNRIDLSITEGEAKDVEAVKVIEVLKIKLPPNLHKGTEVSITYQQNEYQLLRIFLTMASHPEWNYEHKMERISNLSEDDIEMMTGIALKNSVS